MRHLYPRLVPGGAIYSQDAHLSKVANLLNEEGIWRPEVGVVPPRRTRLASPKLHAHRCRLPIEGAASVAERGRAHYFQAIACIRLQGAGD